MRAIARTASAILLLALGLGCGDDQQGPGADGPPFFSATIDGEPWSPDTFGALFSASHSEQTGVIFDARRNTDDGGTEILSINLFMDDLFGLTSYPLDTGGAGEGAGFFDQRSNPTEPGPGYNTDEAHRGTLTITGANTTDSVVSGVFAFPAVNPEGEVRQFRGEFRVRYTMYEF